MATLGPREAGLLPGGFEGRPEPGTPAEEAAERIEFAQLPLGG